MTPAAHCVIAMSSESLIKVYLLVFAEEDIAFFGERVSNSSVYENPLFPRDSNVDSNPMIVCRLFYRVCFACFKDLY